LLAKKIVSVKKNLTAEIIFAKYLSFLTPATNEPLAQSVEHLTFNQVVVGSTPTRLTMSPSSSPAQDTALSRRRRRFKSGWGRQLSERSLSFEEVTFFCLFAGL
jgi:hypothetical protein